MATSLGYVLMNWTSTFSKKQRKKKTKTPIVKETKGCQTHGNDCDSCQEKVQRLQDLQSDLSNTVQISDELKKKLSAANSSLAKTMERESKLRNEYESLTLDEAQVRYELDLLNKQLSNKLEERDEAHADRIRALEQTLQDKECEWVHKNEELRRDLRQAIRTSIQDTEREVESIDNLEQEIDSLRAVLEMRSAENRDLRVHNNELITQVERLSYLEGELRNSQHRLDEMTLVLQNKMDSERELLELSETLQEELVKSRSETLQYRKDLENRQYLQLQENGVPIKPTLKVKHSQPELFLPKSQPVQHRNQHQQASSGGDKNLVMNVREKTESVAWMIQMPTSGSPGNQRRNIKSK